MLEKGTGAILFTTGLSAIYPIPIMGNVGIALAGLRNYANNLHSDLQPKGIYVGHLSLGVFIKPGTLGLNLHSPYYFSFSKSFLLRYGKNMECH